MSDAPALPGPDGPNPVAPPWLNSGDNAWQLTAATFVALQSIPGLMVLYAGIVKKKWAINSAFMCFYAFAMVLLCWVTFAFRMSFGEQWIPILGRPGSAISMDRELQQSYLPAAGVGQAFPLSTMVYFQFVFAAITVIILAGALLGRMNIVAWMMFVPLWLTFSYTVVAFSIWGGGFLYKKGVVDYSGGYVIHLSSGTAGFVAAYWVGPRTDKDRADFQPNNVLVAMIGAGILWTGWNGFNGGDPYTASPDAGAAVLNTNIATAMSLLCWTALDIAFFKKPSIIGSVQGMITGLVAITPAAGVVAGWGAIIIGFASGTLPWVSMNVAGRRLGLFRVVDDTLGVFHTHLVAGFIGGMCVGFFATGSGDAAFALTNPGGAIDGNWKQVWLQLVGALFVIGWNLAVTTIICLLIRLVVPLRMSEEALEIGDDAVHGEEAYAFYGDGRRALHQGDFVTPAAGGDAEMGVLAGRDPMMAAGAREGSEGKSSGSGEGGIKRD